MSINIETVKTAGAEMPYFRFGAGNDTMVILPGMSIKSVMYSADFVASAYSIFADRFTVYCFERRNDLPERYDVRDMARDTAAAMDALGISGAYLFGVSLGGIIAQFIAAERPDLVCRLKLGSTTANFTEEANEKLGEWIEMAEKKDVNRLVMEFAGAVYSDALLKSSRKAFEQLANLVTDDELARFITIAGGIKDVCTYDVLDRIKCPVFVIGGAKDKLTTLEMQQELARRTNAKTYFYDDGVHSVYDEKPDYKQRVLEFFIGE